MFFERAFRRTATAIEIMLDDGVHVDLPSRLVAASVMIDNNTGARANRFPLHFLQLSNRR